MSKIFSFAILFGSICLLCSCATYQSSITPARDHLSGGRCDDALKILQTESEKPNGDQLVYLLDYATALQVCGQYKKSSEVFQKADLLSDQIDYHSVSRITGATLLNEEMIQYKGDTFEKLFINAAAALNYLQMGQPDEALVEVRRINEKYAKLQNENKKKFELNSFSQYLAGLIYESEKNYDDACISYKASYELDMSYRTVGLDMLRGCWLAKRTQEYEKILKLVKPTPEELAKIKQKNKNEILIVYLQGWGPRKAARPENYSMPYLVPVRNATQKIQVQFSSTAESSNSMKSELVYNVEKAAIQTLEDDYTSLIARRVGSRVAKEVLADQVRQKDQLLGAVTWLVMVASDRADLRQWSTLPQTVQVIRTTVPASETSLKVSGLNQSNLVSESLPDIELQLNSSGVLQKRIYLVRSLK